MNKNAPSQVLGKPRKTLEISKVQNHGFLKGIPNDFAIMLIPRFICELPNKGKVAFQDQIVIKL